MPAFLRIIRFTKMTALLAAIWSISYVVLIVGWQILTFIREGNWPAASVKFVLTFGHDQNVTYTTAATRGIARGDVPGAFDRLLEAPAILPLLCAAALLIAFFLWLSRLENNMRRNEIIRDHK